MDFMNEKAAYLVYMDFESKKPKLQKAVKEWKKGEAPNLRIALKRQGINCDTLVDYEEDYLQKLIEE